MQLTNTAFVCDRWDRFHVKSSAGEDILTEVVWVNNVRNHTHIWLLTPVVDQLGVH